MLNQYTSTDVLLFALYGLILLVSGWYFNRRASTTSDYFLGGHAMPVWMVAMSVLATSQSAATFLGGPDQGYRGNLSYLATNLGAFIAAFFVARFLIPRFYQLNVFTVYELLEVRFGARAKQQAGLMYLFGRVFASGARLYMAALAVAMILYGDIEPASVITATVIISLIGLIYSIYGGIRTVIYSDVMQAFTYIAAAVAVIIALIYAIPADAGAIWAALQDPGNTAGSKLTLFDTRLDFSPAGVFTLSSVFTGFVLLNIAAFGLDQDMTQRVLTCKNAQQGARAMLLSVVMVIPVMLLFIVIGLLLYIYYQQPALMAQDNGAPTPVFAGEAVTIFMYYVLTDLPAGLKGLVTIGILAAALSTLNSGLNSMSSVLIQDLYRPWKLKRKTTPLSEQHFVNAGRVAMAIVAMALASMACLCYYWQQYSDTPLLQFALGVMVFSYSGLLGVYFVTLFTQRGSPTSVASALLSGFIVSLLLQPYVMNWLLPEKWQFSLGFTWQLVIGTAVASLVCLLGHQKQSEILSEGEAQ